MRRLESGRFPREAAGVPQHHALSAPVNNPGRDGPPLAGGSGGILARVTESDLGVVDRPAVTPHLRFHAIGGSRTLLISETFNTLIRGDLPGKLLPLMNGERRFGEIAAELGAEYPEADIGRMIASLAARGYVISAEHDMQPGVAAYWSSLGASPRRAREELNAARVALFGDTGALEERLKSLGVRTGARRPALSVVVCDDYLDDGHAALNRERLASGTCWMLVRPAGMRPLFGPVFRPAEQGPCWACLAYRMRGHQEVHNFLRNLSGETNLGLNQAANPDTLSAIEGLVAAEIAKWLVLREGAPLNENAISMDLAAFSSERHPVMRRPQCFACGDENLYRPDREAAPIEIEPRPKPIRNSGGLRAVPPERTLAEYQHLISPVSGVVSWLRRTTDEADPWLHVYWADSNLALQSRELSSLRRSLRSKSAGKGSSPQQSRASALCEALERYSGALHGDEIRRRSSYAELARGGERPAIHPNEVQLFSERQLDHARELNRGGHPYNIVPPRLDPQAQIDWTPVWSLTRKRPCYLPTSMLYSVPAENRGSSDLIADSNGCAAGNTREEAILQGFLELVERDAFAIWWYNRLVVPELDLDSFGHDYLSGARGYYEKNNREMWVLDVTSDLEIPVFVAVSRRTDQPEEDIIYGAGAHRDPQIAALRAVCELNQCLGWVRGAAGGARHTVNDPLSRWWWETGKLAEHGYLKPRAGQRRRRPDYPAPDLDDLAGEVERCCRLAEDRGMEFLVLDQTRPDIGLPVVRVIVPGLRHFWARFAPGRLYDVPVEMGLKPKPLREAELNPAPVIA